MEQFLCKHIRLPNLMDALLIALIALFIQPAIAEINIAPIFGSHMVLQSETAVKVWGTAVAGEVVVVTFSGQKKEAIADKGGKWLLTLDPLKYGQSGVFKVNETIFQDVLVGEVWLGSGQSNMAGRVKVYAKKDPKLKNMSQGTYPHLRLYNSYTKKWAIARPQTNEKFSALLFAFGLSLNQALNVPVGLMYGAVSATTSSRWLLPEMAEDDAELMAALKEKSGIESISELNVKAAITKKRYLIMRAKMVSEGKEPHRFRGAHEVGDLFESHLSHIVPYTFRGVLWDQGEGRKTLPGTDQYLTMNALINGWRNLWNHGDFYFLHMQKPSGSGCALSYDNPINIGARKCRALPKSDNQNSITLSHPLAHINIAKIKNSPLVTTSDLEPGIHPRNKSGYGMRASIVALGLVYNQNIVTSGPTFVSQKIEGSRIRISFDHIGKGLVFKHMEKLQGFEISAGDGIWMWANAIIDGGNVVISHPDIKEPTMSRYGFRGRNNFSNLFNKDGWPAIMFSSQY